MPSRTSRIVMAGLAVVVLAGSATDAFAIRNRYTNEQNQGFTGLLFGDYGDDLPGQRPVYRSRRAPVFGAPGYRDDMAYRGPRYFRDDPGAY